MTKYKYATIDIESTGLSRFINKVTYVGIGLAEEVGMPIGKNLIFNMSQPKSLQRLKNVIIRLRVNNIKIIWQNGKFDTLFLEYEYGIKLPIHHDVMLLGTAYDMVALHGLKIMAKNYLGVADWDISLKDKTSVNSKTVEKYLLDGDVRYTWELFCYFHKKVTPRQWLVYNKLLKPAYLMYRRAERYGVYLNLIGLNKVKKEYSRQEVLKLAVLKKHYDINWNSATQVSQTLFANPKSKSVDTSKCECLPVMKLTGKGVPSADAKVLKKLSAKGHDLPKKLLEYKFYYGANSKFLNKWGTFASYDGRIHPNFGLTNVRTGRTSCSDPNLQQVPRNKELRTLFTAPPGRVMMEADYSQIELRIAADYSNDPTMIQVYRDGGDIHAETGCSLAGCSLDNLAKEDRNKAKAVNFGFLFGMQAKGFIDYAFDSYGTIFSSQEAVRYRELFFAKYNRLLPWHDEMAIECKMQGGVSNRWGQFRALPDIYSQDWSERAGAERRAINTPVQSTASGLLLLAAVEVDHMLRREIDLRIVGTIHDSILMDMPEDCVEDAKKEVMRIMAHPHAMEVFGVEFKVPILADVGIGPWGAH